MKKSTEEWKISIITIMMLCSCQKQITVEAPNTNPPAEVVYSTDANATAVLTGLYTVMARTTGFAQGTWGVSLNAGLAADELLVLPGAGSPYTEVYLNRPEQNLDNTWRELYRYIYRVNAAIEGVSASTTLSLPVRNQCIGEAKFMRAFFYFYLVNLFGDVPLLLNTDLQQNRSPGRTRISLVYQQIMVDLKEAASLLKEYFVTPEGLPTEERVRPSKMAAWAMLARVSLYMDDWQSAEAYASLVINNRKMSLAKLQEIFIKNSSETIWQLQPVTTEANSFDGEMFIWIAQQSYQAQFELTQQLLSNFEQGDARKTQWISSFSVGGPTHYFPFKYKVKNPPTGSIPVEYHMMIRLGEIYLIRAEAAARLGMFPDAIADLRLIRSRAGLITDNTMVDTKEKFMTLLMHERQVELFTEWGHRWFDMIRTGSIDSAMQVVALQKGSTWRSYLKIFPIPRGEIAVNPNLSQNPGY